MRMLKAGDVIISKEQEDGIVSSMKSMAKDITRLHVECEMLKKENANLLKDAARYLWLCEKHRQEGPSFHVRTETNEVANWDLDKQIDAEMGVKA